MTTMSFAHWKDDRYGIVTTSCRHHYFMTKHYMDMEPEIVPTQFIFFMVVLIRKY